MRDALQPGYPLRTLLRAIAGQVDEFAADIGQLYDNWFIETCDDDLVPYFAELVGLSLGPSLPASADASDSGADAIWRRAQVADAIADRSRKGSFSVLEQLATQATGWPARAIELRRMALATQSVRMPDIGRRRLIDLADMEALELLTTPLSDAAPLTDVRRLSSHRTPGTIDPSAVAVWLWRLAADQVSRAPAASAGRGEPLHIRPARPRPPARGDPGQRSRRSRRRRNSTSRGRSPAARWGCGSRTTTAPRAASACTAAAGRYLARRSWSPTSAGGMSARRTDASASIRCSAGSPSRRGILPRRRSR